MYHVRVSNRNVSRRNDRHITVTQAGRRKKRCDHGFGLHASTPSAWHNQSLTNHAAFCCQNHIILTFLSMIFTSLWTISDYQFPPPHHRSPSPPPPPPPHHLYTLCGWRDRDEETDAAVHQFYLCVKWTSNALSEVTPACIRTPGMTCSCRSADSSTSASSSVGCCSYDRTCACDSWSPGDADERSTWT